MTNPGEQWFIDQLSALDGICLDNEGEIVRAAQHFYGNLAQREKGTIYFLIQYGQAVMDALKQYGPSIVPHLLDNDENDGERFRQTLAKAKLEL